MLLHPPQLAYIVVLTMNIIKRTGRGESWRREKIAAAISAAFESVGSDPSNPEISAMTDEIETAVRLAIDQGQSVQVEMIQDLVEKTLVERNFYAEVKSFILYREDRTKKRAARTRLLEAFPTDGEEGETLRNSLHDALKSIQQDFPAEEYSLENLWHKYFSFLKDDLSPAEALSLLVRAAVELTTQEAPRWEFIAARLLLLQFRSRLEKAQQVRGLTSFYDKIAYLSAEGLYGEYILMSYTPEEIARCASFLRAERDLLFTYSGLDLLLRRYVIRSRSHEPLESPQELFMGIALHLAMNESERRLERVQEFYDVLSRLQITVATPTLSNARKPYHQLSSCFIDTVPDSLDGIYRSIDNFAQVSKFGGGMGMYFGKVRAVGGPIRGFQGVAGGIIRWIKLANDTAVAVDQLGVRQGSVAVYLDAWHKDLPEFLQLRTNNGDDRMKAHDVFPAVCYPDLFWKNVRDSIDSTWYLMCPHEILTVKGWALEDSWGAEWEKRYLECVADPRISKREIPLKDLVRLIIKSAVETGTPFAFNRDQVNLMNPNGHRGVIYCSNLCTEIAQNMSAIELVKKEVRTADGDLVVVETTRPGDFVVCNLASLVLGNIDFDKADELERVVNASVRMLDNVIDLNFYPVLYAEVTNRRYRPIGLGVSGYHHLLAKNAVKWESQEHLDFADRIFERVNFAAVSASTALAAEKGRYQYSDGSDWESGAYFEKRGYLSPAWTALRKKVAAQGMRNAYLMAVAPTSSTSIIAGTTAGLDPVMKRYFLEEKKGMIVPRVAPDLSMETFWYYKNAHLIDQSWVIRAAGARSRHIDQAQSLNLYVTTDFSLRQVLDLYVQAWEAGVKTIYYVRSQALEVEECEVCSS